MWRPRLLILFRIQSASKQHDHSADMGGRQQRALTANREILAGYIQEQDEGKTDEANDHLRVGQN